jgi:hypothetical protein
MKNGHVSYGRVEPTSLKKKKRKEREKRTSVLRVSRTHLSKKKKRKERNKKGQVSETL